MKERRDQEEEKNMRATVYHGPRDMRIDQVPDPIIQAPTDVVARITQAGFCGPGFGFFRGSWHPAAGGSHGNAWVVGFGGVGAGGAAHNTRGRAMPPSFTS